MRNRHAVGKGPIVLAVRLRRDSDDAVLSRRALRVVPPGEGRVGDRELEELGLLFAGVAAVDLVEGIDDVGVAGGALVVAVPAGEVALAGTGLGDERC